MSRRAADPGLTLAGPALWWLVVFFAVPLAIMVAISFAQRGPYGALRYAWSWADYEKSAREAHAESPAGPAAEGPSSPPAPHGPTGYLRYLLANYERAFDPLYLRIYARSVALALATTVLCLLIGYPVAYAMALLAPARWRNGLLMLVVVPFWTSFLVRTYAWILILRNDGLINTLLARLQAGLAASGLGGLAGLLDPPYAILYNDFAVLVGLVYGELPFMILPLYATIQKLDTSLLEAAADLGATPITRFFRVTLPLTRPGIVAGTIFVLIPSIGAFVIPDLLGGSKSIMVGNLIQNQFTFTRDLPFGSAVCFLLAAVVLLVLFLNAHLARQPGEEEEQGGGGGSAGAAR
jgi:spermidine/putrescine transport system permease protein